MRLYFFDCPCYNLPDWKKSKRDRREHLLFSGQAAKNRRFWACQNEQREFWHVWWPLEMPIPPGFIWCYAVLKNTFWWPKFVKSKKFVYMPGPNTQILRISGIYSNFLLRSPGRKNRKWGSNYTQNISPPATSRRPLKSWSGASRKATKPRLYWGLRDLARPSRWPISSSNWTSPRWSLHTIKPSQRSSTDS